ncbi:MAG: ABC transporter permease [candidate division Zixibacteria bacterium]|nr:ABC transporter permease [candidate division Zixibacteria bacterium]
MRKSFEEKLLKMFAKTKENLRTIKTAGKLGWAMESNWTDPLLFAIYSIVRPIASSLILVVMYYVITRGKTGLDLFAYMYVGNAFFMYVINVLFGISWVIHEDRDHYQMIRYIYISPIRMYYYLFGRGIAKMVLTTVAVIITMAFGMLVLKIPVNLLAVDYPLLLFSVAAGIFIIACLGILLAGVSMVTAHHSYALTEGMAGLFYLACGAIYPIDILPIWLQYLSKALPLTYWLELVRRSVLGKSLSPTLSGYSNFQLILIMAATTLVLALFSHWVYRSIEYIARKHGKIDQLTNY